MAIGSILVPISGGKGSASALEAAIQVGREFGAYVEVLHARIDPNQAVPVLAEGMTGTLVAEMIQTLEESAQIRASAAHEFFDERCGTDAVPVAGFGAAGSPPGFCVGYVEITGRADDEIALRGKLFDLIVVERPHDDEDEGIYPLVLESALFATGRPVLLAPPVATKSLSERIAVAWNDTREAARTLGAALPFLSRADAVTVFSVHDHCDADPDKVLGYLSRHGVSAEARILEPDHRPIDEQLLDEARAMEADLFVMGAYSHSHWRELVLGGTTRGMSKSATIPVLMAH